MLYAHVDIQAVTIITYCDLPHFHNALQHYSIRNEFFYRI